MALWCFYSLSFQKIFSNLAFLEMGSKLFPNPPSPILFPLIETVSVRKTQSTELYLFLRLCSCYFHNKPTHICSRCLGAAISLFWSKCKSVNLLSYNIERLFKGSVKVKAPFTSFLFVFLFFCRSRWSPSPVFVATATRLWHHWKGNQTFGQLLPGGHPQAWCVPVRGGHQAW